MTDQRRPTDFDRRYGGNESLQKRHEILFDPDRDAAHLKLVREEYAALCAHAQASLGRFIPDEREAFMTNCRTGFLDTILSNARYQYIRLTMAEAAHLLGRIVLRQVDYPVSVAEWEKIADEVTKRSFAAANHEPVSEHRPSPGRDY